MTDPNIVTWRCEHQKCRGVIEFHARYASDHVPCPHCGEATGLGRPSLSAYKEGLPEPGSDSALRIVPGMESGAFGEIRWCIKIARIASLITDLIAIIITFMISEQETFRQFVIPFVFAPAIIIHIIIRRLKYSLWALEHERRNISANFTYRERNSEANILRLPG